MAGPGSGTLDNFQPTLPPYSDLSANRINEVLAKLGGLGWEIPFVVPITLQCPQVSIAGPPTFVASRKVNRPLIIRGLLFQTNIPKPTIYLRAGYNSSLPTSLSEVSGANNIISILGGGGSSSQSDGFAMCIAGTMLSPIYVPIDDPNSILWASLESTGPNGLTDATVTFFCDFTPQGG